MIAPFRQHLQQIVMPNVVALAPQRLMSPLRISSLSLPESGGAIFFLVVLYCVTPARMGEYCLRQLKQFGLQLHLCSYTINICVTKFLGIYFLFTKSEFFSLLYIWQQFFYTQGVKILLRWKYFQSQKRIIFSVLYCSSIAYRRLSFLSDILFFSVTFHLLLLFFCHVRKPLIHKYFLLRFN